MISLYHSDLSPYARRVLIVLEEKVLAFKRHKHRYAREFDALTELNPCLLLPVYVDEKVTLWGSNLIVEYLLSTYPNVTQQRVAPPLSDTMTRAGHHWNDSKVLATIETMTDSIMNLRQMKMSGLEAESNAYLTRQRKRIELCLDWLEQAATLDGFVPGMFTVMDINLICALGNVDNQRSFEWRGRPTLEALVGKFSTRQSVNVTALE